jgi:hypothetical protein
MTLRPTAPLSAACRLDWSSSVPGTGLRSREVREGRGPKPSERTSEEKGPVSLIPCFLARSQSRSPGQTRLGLNRFRLNHESYGDDQERAAGRKVSACCTSCCVCFFAAAEPAFRSASLALNSRKVNSVRADPRSGGRDYGAIVHRHRAAPCCRLVPGPIIRMAGWKS